MRVLKKSGARVVVRKKKKVRGKKVFDIDVRKLSKNIVYKKIWPQQ